jgi:hypothetical protein
MSWVSGPNLIVAPEVDVPGSFSDFGPYEQNGKLYVVINAGGLRGIYIQDSPLGLPNWSLVPFPGDFDNAQQYKAVGDPIIYLLGSNDGFDTLQVYTFDTVSQAYSFVSQTPLVEAFFEKWLFRIVPTSDGSIVVIYYNTVGGVRGLRCLRYKSGSWSGQMLVHQDTESRDAEPTGMLPYGDRVYISYTDLVFAAPNQSYLRILYADNTLSSVFSVLPGVGDIGSGTFNSYLGPTMAIFGGEIFLNLLGVFTRRCSNLDDPSAWVTDSFPDTEKGGPGGNYVVIGGKLFSIWNYQETDGGGSLTKDIMYGSQYRGGGGWCPREIGMDFVEHPAPDPFIPYPNQFSHLQIGAHALADGSIGQVCDFLIGGIFDTCTIYYANYTVRGCAGGVYPQRRRPRWIGNRA